MQDFSVIPGCDFSGFNDCRDFNAAPLPRFGLPLFCSCSVQSDLTLFRSRFALLRSGLPLITPTFLKIFKNFSKKGGLGMTQAVIPSLNWS